MKPGDMPEPEEDGTHVVVVEPNEAPTVYRRDDGYAANHGLGETRWVAIGQEDVWSQIVLPWNIIARYAAQIYVAVLTATTEENR